jgi:hypothetical protein
MIFAQRFTYVYTLDRLTSPFARVFFVTLLFRKRFVFPPLLLALGHHALDVL